MKHLNRTESLLERAIKRFGEDDPIVKRLRDSVSVTRFREQSGLNTAKEHYLNMNRIRK